MNKENNVLIAEFMGAFIEIVNHYVMEGNYPKFPTKYEPVEYASFDGSLVRLNHLVYDKKWELLIPVIEKIESLGFSFNIKNEASWVAKWHYKGLLPDDISFISETKIDGAYQAVIQFIKWYNTKQQ